MPHATNPDGETGMSLNACLRTVPPSLFGLAPGGVYPAASVTRDAVRSYRTVSPLPPGPAFQRMPSGGLFSVALSLGSPPPAVSRHRIPVEPGLSSNACTSAVARPSGRTRGVNYGLEKDKEKSSILKKRSQKTSFNKAGAKASKPGNDSYLTKFFCFFLFTKRRFFLS